MPNPVPTPAGSVSAAGSAPGPAPQPADAAAILEQLPDGIALVSRNDGICWANGRLAGWCGRSDVCGLDFFEALGRPEVLGPDATPFRTAIESGRMTTATLRTADNRYFHVQSSAAFATFCKSIRVQVNSASAAAPAGTSARSMR